MRTNILVTCTNVKMLAEIVERMSKWEHEVTGFSYIHQAFDTLRGSGGRKRFVPDLAFIEYNPEIKPELSIGLVEEVGLVNPKSQNYFFSSYQVPESLISSLGIRGIVTRSTDSTELMLDLAESRRMHLLGRDSPKFYAPDPETERKNAQGLRL